MATHTYRTVVAWEGSTGSGYRAYSRRHHASAPPAAEVALSADRHFRGDEEVMNPEQLVVMAASSCQLLSFLAQAARAGIDVVGYEDEARGFMSDASGRPMSIGRIELAPVVHVAPGTDHEAVRALAQQAHHGCYVANSLKSLVTLTLTVQDA